MKAEEVEALFARTIAGEYDSEDAWEAVRELRMSGSAEVFEYASKWCTSDDVLKRARAADVLCQLRRRVEDGTSTPILREEAYALIAKMFDYEQDTRVLDSAISALGHLDNPAGTPLILRYAQHPDTDARFAVSVALGSFPNDPDCVAGLIKLTSDPDAKVRDWAVFGLGVLGDADSPEIREALLRCLDDEDEDVREEAAVGLGKRGEVRLIPKLLKMLNDPDVKLRVAEAAVALLGLDSDPPEWVAADYEEALKRKFNL